VRLQLQKNGITQVLYIFLARPSLHLKVPFIEIFLSLNSMTLLDRLYKVSISQGSSVY